MTLAARLAAAVLLVSPLAAETPLAAADPGAADGAVTDTTAVIPVNGMHCHSADEVDGALKKVPGVRSVHTEFEEGRTTVVFDAAQVKPEAIVAAIAATGYEPGKPVAK